MAHLCIALAKLRESSTSQHRRLETERRCRLRGVSQQRIPDWHNEGQLAAEGINAAAKSAGVTGKLVADYSSQLEKNNQLVQTLCLTGTLGLIVMPVKNSTPASITVFPGAATAEQIQTSIKKASH